MTDLNECLKAVCDDEHLSFWQHQGFWNIQKQIFRHDVIHFNDLGNYKLWQSVKGEIFGALKSVQKQ